MSPKHNSKTQYPILKWLSLGCLGTVGLISLTVLILVWKFTPFFEVKDNKVSILGGTIVFEDGENFQKSHFNFNFSAVDHDQDDEAIDSKLSDHAQVKIIDATQFKGLQLNHEAGDIVVRKSKDHNISLKYDRCVFKEEKSQDWLQITFKADQTQKTCQTPIELLLPESLALSISLGSGNLEINELTQALDIKLGSGDVTTHNISSHEIKISSGNGDINVHGMAQNAQLSLGRGDVKYTLNKLRQVNGHINIRTGAGDIFVMVPKDIDLHSELSTSVGSIHNEIKENAQATFRLQMSSSTGDLSVKYL